jgi:glycosyltransferase involved in cell wall biosynthesis
MDKKEKLILISLHYPYGWSETFLENEIYYLAKKFDNITILPLFKDDNYRQIPKNVDICNVLSEKPKRKKMRLKNFIAFCNLTFLLFFTEFLHTKQKFYFIKKFRCFLDSITQNIQKALLFEKVIENEKHNTMYYSYWMNDGALILSILKIRKRINSFIFRVHGYDLFEERREKSYIPFRYINMKYCKNVYAVSKNGKDYLLAKNIFREKLKLSYLGTYDYGKNPFNKQCRITIVSCSNIIELKRVDLIPEILKQVTIPVKWVHFGSGEYYSKIKEKIEKLNDNIEIELKGHVKNNEIIKFYKSIPVHLFIHLSQSEGGVPVAIQEAASFGIPILGTDAGGIPEIVNKHTGILLENDFKINKVAKIINKFQYSKYNSLKFRNGVRLFWEHNFNAENNYEKFYNKITGNHS